MNPVLVDSDVLLDITTADPVWSGWSGRTLAEEANRSILVINPIIHAEVSMGFDRIEDLEAVLPPEMIRREALPWEAAFLAGRAFSIYRRRGGAKTTPLPDFYIGAHAAVAGHRLLTRDASRYRACFPGLEIISPPGG